MSNGDVAIFGIAGLLGRPEKHFKIHHIINDDGITPITEIPRTNQTDFGTETCAKTFRRINQDLFIFRLRFQTKSIPITAIHHKTNVMVTCIILNIFQTVGVPTGFFCQSLISRQFVSQPHGAGVESACPVFRIFQTVASVRFG